MSSDMDVEVWSELYEDLVYAILSFLPVRVLCKLRTVCKSWNTIICNPGFRALRIQHDAGFVVVRHAIHSLDHEDDGENDGFDWSFLDLDPDKRQWYIADGFRQRAFDDFAYGTGTGAMHGGLVCQRLYGDMDDVAMFVSNPTKYSSKRLPPSPFYSTRKSSVVVNMVCTDTIAQNYKIFLMPSGKDGARLSVSNPLLVVYDSKTKAWRTSINPKPRRTSLVNPNRNADWCGVESSVMLGEMLYVLVSPNVDDGKEHWLWRYSHVEDVWKGTGLCFVEWLCDPQLIVSDNRLFLGARVPFALGVTDAEIRENCGVFAYEISELLLAQRTRRTVCTITGPEVVEMFNWDEIEYSLVDDDKLEAYGYGKFITVFDGYSGNSLVYDPIKSSLKPLPKHPFVARLLDYEVTMWYGNAMNFIGNRVGNVNLAAG